VNRPGDARHLSAEERAAWVARVREYYAAKRAAGEIEAPPTSPADALAELEDDHRAGRTIKHDYRLSPEEKERTYRAANLLGLTASEFVRDVVARACDEILADEPVGVR
jgi:uncharacterized protein (DUF1778 family)